MAVGSTGLLLALVTPGVANAEPSDSAYLHARLATYGVPQDVQDRLVNDFLTGTRMWDSETGAAPVSKEMSRDGDFDQTIRRFADGSVSVERRENPSGKNSGQVSPQSITGCSTYQQQDIRVFTNCLVAWDAVTWSMTYRANYDWYQFGSNISYVGGITYGGAGSFSDVRTEIINGHGGGHAVDALARGVMVQTVSWIFSRTVGINLAVSSSAGARESSFG
jgi:hypothetical protein